MFIAVVFPMDFLELGIFGTNFSLLGLGDIVLPGNHGYCVSLIILLHLQEYLLLYYAVMMQGNFNKFVIVTMVITVRQHPNRSGLYFIVSFGAYILGLVTTIVVMHSFKAAQVSTNWNTPMLILMHSICSLLYFTLCQPVWGYHWQQHCLKENSMTYGSKCCHSNTKDLIIMMAGLKTTLMWSQQRNQPIKLINEQLRMIILQIMRLY